MLNPERGLAVLWVLALSLICGCASVQRQGDRAFEDGDCEHALEFYDEVALTGVQDPEMYHRSALCALRLGDFAASEKYYSQALRFGAGIEVARELASFYVKTSNYVSAIRVYQYLLYQEAEKQPVFNNLGTALMYAGQAFDAESYLMVAQQMDPTDPAPYVNLGLLYDRHLKQPWLAINFYDCYNEVTQGRAQNAQMVRQRSSELRERYERLYQPDAVQCGEAYQPGGTTTQVENLSEVVNEGLPEIAEVEPPPVAEVDDEPNPNAPIIERQVTAEVAPESSNDVLLDRARRAYDEQRWADAVGLFGAVPLSALQPVDHKRLGISYQRQANWAMASHWLELASTILDQEEIVSALFDVYTKARDDDRLVALCTRYGKSSKYEKITATRCNELKEGEK